MDMIIVLIPALDPDERLLKLVKELLDAGFSRIVVVNDGSDSSCDIIFSTIQKLGGIILKHYVNLGKGRAIKTGINYILSNYSQYDGIITADADGQHTITDIERCASKLYELQDQKKMLIGCRMRDNHNMKVPLRSKFGNACTRYVLRYLCGIQVSDSQSGLRVIPRFLLPQLMKVTGEGYEFETNMLLELIDEGIEIIEVPISMVYENGNSTSHFNPIKDSIKIFAVIVKYSLGSLMAAGLDYLIFCLLLLYCNNIWVSTFAGRASSAIFNLSINKKFVFKNGSSLRMQIIKYLWLLILSGSTSAIFVQAIYNIFGVNIFFAKIVIEIIFYFANFYVQKNLIFHKGRR